MNRHRQLAVKTVPKLSTPSSILSTQGTEKQWPRKKLAKLLENKKSSISVVFMNEFFHTAMGQITPRNVYIYIDTQLSKT